MRKIITLSILALLTQVDLNGQSARQTPDSRPGEEKIQNTEFNLATVYTGSQFIRCGAFVNPDSAPGNVTFTSSGSYNLYASESISLEAGTVILPVDDGYFLAEVGTAQRSGSSVTDTKTQDWRVFPNPGAGDFNLLFADNSDRHVLVTDITGRVILEQTISGFSGNIDLTKEKNGIYFIQVKSASGTQTAKVIKHN